MLERFSELLHTLVDELIVPNGKMTNYLTSITGVAEDLLLHKLMLRYCPFSGGAVAVIIIFYTIFMQVGGVESGSLTCCGYFGRIW